MPTKIPKFCMFGRGFGKLRSRVLSKIYIKATQGILRIFTFFFLFEIHIRIFFQSCDESSTRFDFSQVVYTGCLLS